MVRHTGQQTAMQMDSGDVLYILYTSGTTAKPKGIVHTTGGYLTGVSATHRYVFDVKGRRRRLGHQAQLHRLRPALQRHHQCHVGGHPRHPRPRPLLGHH